jgi:type II secretory pathway component PulC
MRSMNMAACSDTTEKTEFVARTIALCLEKPEFGAKRLANLLAQGGVEASRNSVYRILRDHNLHTKQLRVRYLKCKKGEGTMEPTETGKKTLNAEALPGYVPSSVLLGPAIKSLLSAQQPAPAPVAASPPIWKKSPPKRSDTTVARLADLETDWPKWTFRSLNACLAAIAVLLAVQIWDNLRESQRAALPEAAIAAVGAERVVNSPSPRTRLTDYQAVWNRNLFDSHPIPAAAPVPDLEKIKLAGKELGLKLIGTAIASDANQSYAILESAKTRSQDIYRINGSVGGVRVKRILRNNVVIAAADGSELRLTIDAKDFADSPAVAQALAPMPMPASAQPGESAPAPAPDWMAGVDTLPGRSPSEVGRGALNPGINDLKAPVNSPIVQPAEAYPSMDGLTVAPYPKNGGTEGLYVGAIVPGTVLVRYGVSAGDVVKGADGEDITSPEDAADFFRRVAQGENLSITVQRRGRLQTLTLQ